MRKIALTLLLFFMFTLSVSSQIGQSVGSMGSGDFVIFRANIPALYIVNETFGIQAMAIPFQSNKPIMATVTIHVSITGLNVKFNYSNEYQAMAGRLINIYTVPLQEGHYDILIYAEYHGIKSKVIDQDFGVTQAPVPYSLTISQDGSTINFKSLKLNSTGQPDPNYPFTLLIYVDSHGSGESLVRTYTDVTNLTITVPPSWKTGILYVEVVDVYGWHNGNSINLAAMQFSGVPLSYDYYYYERQPIKSHQLYYVFMGVVVLGILLYLYVRFWQAGEKVGRRR